MNFWLVVFCQVAGIIFDLTVFESWIGYFGFGFSRFQGLETLGRVRVDPLGAPRRFSGALVPEWPRTPLN